jgi:hypothetical protein
MRTRASEITDRCVLHGGGKVGVALCEVEDCELPALKGQELCRVHAPKKSRRSTLGANGLPLDALHHHYGFGLTSSFGSFGISSGTMTPKEEEEEFTIDLGDGSQGATPGTPDDQQQQQSNGGGSQTVTSQIDHAHLLSLLQFTQPTLAD